MGSEHAFTVRRLPIEYVSWDERIVRGPAVVLGLEPPPPDCPRTWSGSPIYGGALFFQPELGKAACAHCGWSGVPTIVEGSISLRCPRCR